MGQSSTPLSDLIERCLEQNEAAVDAENFRRLLEGLTAARLGVIVTGRLQGATPGRPLMVREGQAACAMIDLPGGGRMLVACADRPVYLRRFSNRFKFNADVDARTLITIALANEACQGIMLNSAVTERSVALARELLPGLLERCKAPSAPPVAWKRTTSLRGPGAAEGPL